MIIGNQLPSSITALLAPWQSESREHDRVEIPSLRPSVRYLLVKSLPTRSGMRATSCLCSSMEGLLYSLAHLI